MAVYKSAVGVRVDVFHDRSRRPVELSFDRSGLGLSIDEAIALAEQLVDAVSELRSTSKDVA